MAWEIMEAISIVLVGCFCLFMMVCGNTSRYYRKDGKAEALVEVRVKDRID